MLVLDASVLIRAVLGKPLLQLVLKYREDMEFVASDTAFQGLVSTVH